MIVRYIPFVTYMERGDSSLAPEKVAGEDMASVVALRVVVPI